MSIELGSVLSAVAASLIAVVGWAGPRWTKEGRLLARIRRLGQAHATLPDSSERAELGETLTALANDLNAWNATDQRLVRRWRIWTTAAALVVSYTVVLVVWPPTSHSLESVWLSSLMVGTLAGVVSIVVTELAERVIVQRAAGALRSERELEFREGRRPHST